jgi:hypothetical protein
LPAGFVEKKVTTVEAGSTEAVNMKVTGADTETPLAPFWGLLVTVV